MNSALREPSGERPFCKQKQGRLVGNDTNYIDSHRAAWYRSSGYPTLRYLFWLARLGKTQSLRGK